MQRPEDLELRRQALTEVLASAIRNLSHEGKMTSTNASNAIMQVISRMNEPAVRENIDDFLSQTVPVSQTVPGGELDPGKEAVDKSFSNAFNQIGATILGNTAAAPLAGDLHEILGELKAAISDLNGQKAEKLYAQADQKVNQDLATNKAIDADEAADTAFNRQQKENRKDDEEDKAEDAAEAKQSQTSPSPLKTIPTPTSRG